MSEDRDQEVGEELVDLEFERATRDGPPQLVYNAAWWGLPEDPTSFYVASRWFELADDGEHHEDLESGLTSWHKAKMLYAAAEMTERHWPEELATMDAKQQKVMFENTCTIARTAFPGFTVQYADERPTEHLLARALCGSSCPCAVSWDTAFFPDRASTDEEAPWLALQHAVVHMWDMRTFFGLVSAHRTWAAYFCVPLFLAAMHFQRILAIAGGCALALHLPLLLVLPPAILLLLAPNPVRIYAELRAYRRSIELVPPELREPCVDAAVKRFHPLVRRLVRRALPTPSPYSDPMNSWLAFRKPVPIEGVDDARS